MTYTRNTKIVVWLFIFGLIIMSPSRGFAQFYVSKACVLDMQASSDGSSSEGCPNATYFFDTDTSSVAWDWSFGDLADTIPETGRNPQYFYSRPGDYIVSLTKTSKTGFVETVSQTITVGSLPKQPKFNDLISTDTTVCENKVLKLEPFKLGSFPGNYTYLWYPGGDTTRTIEVDSSGCYSVEVFSENGCSRTANINVKFCFQESSGGGGGSEKWFFGNGATLEFQNSDGVEVPRDSLAPDGDIFADVETDSITVTAVGGASNPLNSNVATAMVYGPNGSLAFYSDGKNVYDGDDEIILDIDGNALLNGDNTATQGLTIIPKTSCNECPHHQYYVFSTDKSTNLLSYSIIDMRYNEGKGLIIEKDIPVAYGITDRMTVQAKTDDSGFDLFTHQTDSDEFQIIRIDSLGVQVKSQSIGLPQDSLANPNGYVVFDEAGEKMAHGLVVEGKNIVEIYDYDSETNDFSGPITIDLGIDAPPQIYGLAFSASGDFLYATLSGDPSKGETSYLLKIPLISGVKATIESSISVIQNSATEQFGALQMGPVNKNSPGGKYIFMVVGDKDKVAYIQDPESEGGASVSGFISSSQGVFVGGLSALGFPTVVYATPSQDGAGISASYFGNCFNAATGLETQGICDPMRNEISWEFEDGTILKGENVNYTFPHLGWNTFLVRIKVFNESKLNSLVNSPILDPLVNLTDSECTEEVIIDSIYIKPSPVLSLADEAYVCTKEVPVTYAELNAHVTGGDTFTYKWQTSLGTSINGVNQADSVISVIAPATYVLEVVNNYECLTMDEVDVSEGCAPRVFFPEAFTPEGANPLFKVEYAFVEDVNLKIFNRWGELVYETNNLDLQWDGRVKGKIQAPTVYAYILTYKAVDFPERGILKELGSVWVLR